MHAAQHIAGSSLLISPSQLHLPSDCSAHSLDVPVPSGILDEPGSPAQDSFSVSDLDGSASIVSDTTPGFLLYTVDANPECTNDLHEGEYVYQGGVDFPDEDAPLDNTDLGDEANPALSLGPLISNLTDGTPDPFVVEPERWATARHQGPEIPTHLLVMYTMVSWLHFQFHVPHVACSAILAFLGLLFKSFNLDIVSPFITLQSATWALGVDPGILFLAVCPKCRRIHLPLAPDMCKRTAPDVIPPFFYQNIHG